MTKVKKFGTFADVFTPSLLTILGVIMYMRLGWFVGNAGLIGSVALMVIAHVISVTTGLSISSVCGCNVTIKIIDYAVQQMAFYDLIKQYSSTTDLTLIGIPNYKIELQAESIVKTNQLFENIGSTLLVKAANNFNVLNLDFKKETS